MAQMLIFTKITKYITQLYYLLRKMRPKKTMEAKIVMVGDVGVGKSSITVRYVLQKFQTRMQSTLGAAYMEKMHECLNGKHLKLKIWDTAGQEKYRAIARLYYKDCQVAILIYDVTRRGTFQSLNAWVEEIAKHAPNNTVYALVANKIDLLSSHQFNGDQSQIVKKQEGEGYARLINATFHEVSAKNMHGISQLFADISQRAVLQIQKSVLSTKEEETSKNSAKLSKNSFIEQTAQKNKRKKCCQAN